jgi:hypothetical protein
LPVAEALASLSAFGPSLDVLPIAGTLMATSATTNANAATTRPTLKRPLNLADTDISSHSFAGADRLPGLQRRSSRKRVDAHSPDFCSP